MARASTETRQLTDAERASIDATNQQLLSQQTDLENTIAPGYRDLLANPGYTQAQQAAITGASEGALSSAFDSLAENAANRLARTRNSAGYADSLDQLTRDQAQQSAATAQQTQIAFANRAQQNQLSALQGLSGLYGVDASLLGRTLGIPAELLGVRQRADGSSSASARIGFGPIGLSFGFGG